MIKVLIIHYGLENFIKIIREKQKGRERLIFRIAFSLRTGDFCKLSKTMFFKLPKKLPVRSFESRVTGRDIKSRSTRQRVFHRTN